MPGYGGGIGGDNAPGNEAGAGGGGGAGGGTGGEGGRTDAPDSYGYGPAANPGRGVNPGRGFAGSGPGGYGRDPGWDRPGGYDYGPNGDVVTKVDPVTQERTFRVYGQAYNDWADAQLEQARRDNPVAGWIGTALSKTTMGRVMRATGRMFGQDIHQDGSPVGGTARSEPGMSETAQDERERREAAEKAQEPPGAEKPPTDQKDPNAAQEAYQELLARIRGNRGNTDWQTPDWGWIYELSGLAPPEEPT